MAITGSPTPGDNLIVRDAAIDTPLTKVEGILYSASEFALAGFPQLA
jgi:hypothetical protein